MSRLTGVLRDATIARFLGASALSDAFYTAFRIPNAFRAIVGEGGLPGAFVPMAKKVQRERPGEEGVYAGRMLTLLLLVLVVLTAVGVAAAPFLVALFAEGFKTTPGKFDLTVTLTRWLFPYILLVSVAALLEAWLNAKGRFQLSAATPIALNLAIVAAAWLLAPAGVPPTTALVAGVLAGGLAQFLMQAPAARKLGMRFGGDPFGDPEVKETALLIAPRLYGYGVGQISFLISSRTLAALGNAYVTFNLLRLPRRRPRPRRVRRLADPCRPAVALRAGAGGGVGAIPRDALAVAPARRVRDDSVHGRAHPPRPARHRRHLPPGPLRSARRDADGDRGRLLRARALRGGGREDPDAGLLRAPRHADAGRRRDVRPRRLLAPLRGARRSDEARRASPSRRRPASGSTSGSCSFSSG